jgi:Zn-dependent protease
MASTLSFVQALKRQPGQSTIKWMMIMQDRWWAQILAVPAFLLLFSASLGDLSLAVVMLMSMYLHEGGHAFVFMLKKIKCHVLLLFPLGAVAAPINEEQDKLSDLLPWNDQAWIMQAGPLVNVGLILVGLLINNVFPESGLGNKFIFMNTLLAVFNLVPVWHLDAGQFFNMIFSSLKERYDKGIAIGAAALLAILIFVITVPAFHEYGASWLILLAVILTHFGWVLFITVMAAGIWHKQGKDNAEYWKSAQAMKPREIAIHLVVYFVQVFIVLWTTAGPLM